MHITEDGYVVLQFRDIPYVYMYVTIGLMFIRYIEFVLRCFLIYFIDNHEKVKPVILR